MRLAIEAARSHPRARSAIVIALCSLMIVGITACSSSTKASSQTSQPPLGFRSAPSFLPSSEAPVDRVVTASPGHPQLAVQGIGVEVSLPSGLGLATVTGPRVPPFVLHRRRTSPLPSTSQSLMSPAPSRSGWPTSRSPTSLVAPSWPPWSWVRRRRRQPSRVAPPWTFNSMPSCRREKDACTGRRPAVLRSSVGTSSWRTTRRFTRKTCARPVVVTLRRYRSLVSDG